MYRINSGNIAITYETTHTIMYSSGRGEHTRRSEAGGNTQEGAGDTREGTIPLNQTPSHTKRGETGLVLALRPPSRTITGERQVATHRRGQATRGRESTTQPNAKPHKGRQRQDSPLPFIHHHALNARAAVHSHSQTRSSNNHSPKNPQKRI